jgi:hypothetical protein
MTTYELTTGTCEDFNTVQTQLINDFIQQVIGAEVITNVNSIRTGRIVSCYNPNNNFEALSFTVQFGSNESKRYGAYAAITSGGLKFADESVIDLWNSFMEEQYKLKHKFYEASEAAQTRDAEQKKLEKKHKELEKKFEGLKASAEREINNLINNTNTKAKADDFYYALGWLAAHVGTITAKMPDYLEKAFVRHFGNVEHTTVDSTKVGPAGYTSQWRLSMEASLVKAKNIPAAISEYLSTSGKKVSKTSFVWDLVDMYGFKFGKKQDTLDIMRCVPIEYVPMFNAGMKA